MTILILTRRDDVTADVGVAEMQRRGVSYFRLNSDEFPIDMELTVRLDEGLAGRLIAGNQSCDITEISAVWYRRSAPATLPARLEEHGEFIRTESREALEWLGKALDVRWMSRPDRVARAEGKLHQMMYARRQGVRVPRSLLTNSPEEARQFCQEHGAVVAKALRKKLLRDDDQQVAIAFTHRVTESDLNQLGDVALSPILLQEEISKAYEVRVTVFGRQVFATRIDSQGNQEAAIDWRRANSGDLPHREIVLPDHIAAIVERLLDHYDLNFGALDFIVTPDGDWVFLELNPNGQWAWIEALTGQRMAAALVDWLVGDSHG